MTGEVGDILQCDQINTAHVFGRNVLSKKTIGPPNCNCPSFHSSNYRFCLDKEASEHELIPEARRQKWFCPLISTKKHERERASDLTRNLVGHPSTE